MFEFKEVNLNPKNKKTGDCVIRAIANAEQKEWDIVYMRLCSIGLRLCELPNCKRTYEKYLEQNQWYKHKQPRKENGKKYTIEEWCQILWDRERYGSVLFTMANHMTVVKIHKDGCVLEDLWDCSYKTVSNYWTRRG